MKKFSPQPEPVAAVVTAEPVGILTALLDFVLPQTAQTHGASMGRNSRHDLVRVAGLLAEASILLKSVASDATSGKEFAAATTLYQIIERLS
jgi:hypothetical protein